MHEPCLLIFAREPDSAVRLLSEQAPQRVIHVRMSDLFCPGWRFIGGRPDQASAYAGDRVLAVGRIAAVLCRIASVRAEDARHIYIEDRAYAAAETTAFLRAWLAQYRGARFNEPTALSLAGPAWSALQWTCRVARLGIPVTSGRVATATSLFMRETVSATVVGREVLGTDEPVLVKHSLRIARAARARLLTVRFVRDDGWKFQSADPCPALDRNSAAVLLRQAFAQKKPLDESARAGMHESVSCHVA